MAQQDCAVWGWLGNTDFGCLRNWTKEGFLEVDISVSWDAGCVPKLILWWGFWDLLLSSCVYLCANWGLVMCSVAAQHEDFWWEADRVRKAKNPFSNWIRCDNGFGAGCFFLFSICWKATVSVLRSLQIGNEL